MAKSVLTLAAAGLFAGVAIAPVPAAGQETQGSSIGEILVYGNDPCPRQADDEVVVCRRLPETERYRLPENQRPGAARQQRQAWVNRSRDLQTVGATGPGSCSAVGPGGHTGCLIQEIQTAKQQADEAAEADTAPAQ